MMYRCRTISSSLWLAGQIPAHGIKTVARRSRWAATLAWERTLAIRLLINIGTVNIASSVTRYWLSDTEKL